MKELNEQYELRLKYKHFIRHHSDGAMLVLADSSVSNVHESALHITDPITIRGILDVLELEVSRIETLLDFKGIDLPAEDS